MKITTLKRVLLEPELEANAGHLGAFDRLLLARDFERWARQLRVTARAMQSRPSTRRARPPRLAWAQVKEN